ncbi:E3 ubiquitin-protein ligase MARCHF8 [Psilocybe cubensis]|uniref:RING-CH-type domain-containing protein n=2 Tax=Psilocybe cubensis TaxID=181762 RepID=A0A8H7YAQ7_PSICU|nr:E3 ubiquitin-protein ligase MARCHF8 [Psilocybe cubensis]KAH9487014.1 E3 ubiquitin-protein ligase MARCHF8 [Psilocybe cubensis]
MADQEKQCRICLDGVDAEPELGRLIRPCLCKGSISYVHVKCLEQWRKTSSSQSAFFACPQCHYEYRFARTQIVGLAANPIIVGGISGLLFTIIVMMASFITTFLMPAFNHPSEDNFYFFISPTQVASDLIAAAFRIIRDGEFEDIPEDPSWFWSPKDPLEDLVAPQAPGIVRRFIRRFILGLPLVGAASLVQMLISAPFIGPVQWIARYRGNRRNRDSKDIAAVIVVSLLIMGALRALYQVYRFTQKLTKRILLRAEDAILEVN